MGIPVYAPLRSALNRWSRLPARSLLNERHRRSATPDIQRPHTLGYCTFTQMCGLAPITNSRSVTSETVTGKEKELKHHHRIYLRLTDTEYEIVSANAKSANLSLAEYARKQVMNKKVTVKYELVADLPELKKLIAEFGKIGSNLNQIARHFNSGGIHSQEMQKAINQSIARIYEMKYEVLKLTGDFTSTAQLQKNKSGRDSHGNPEAHSE